MTINSVRRMWFQVACLAMVGFLSLTNLAGAWQKSTTSTVSNREYNYQWAIVVLVILPALFILFMPKGRKAKIDRKEKLSAALEKRSEAHKD